MLDRLRPYIEGTVVDIGCGANCVPFGRDLGDRYQGVDMSISYKIPDLPEDADVRIAADFEHEPLPFEDRSYTTAMCMDTLEHLDKPHGTYDELFRVADKYVIISLPNNWPLFLGSFLVGRNRTHTSGYGLPAEPKFDGVRHKHFFNLEEALGFMVGRVPPGFSVKEVHLRFERGKDGLLFMPPMPDLFRKIYASPPDLIREKYGAKGALGLTLAKAALTPLRFLDIVVAAAIWGWGHPVRFYNMFCRQVWVVFEREEGKSA